MSQVLGWAGEEARDAIGPALLRAVASGLPDGSRRLLGGSRWGLIVDSAIDVWSDAHSACAIVGTVRTRDPDLQAAITRVGVPAAFLQALRRDGSQVCALLDGCFAIYVIDGDGARIRLFGDKFGVEPLYFHRANRGVVFADALSGLLRHPWVGREIDLQAVYDYLYFSMVPSPATGYRDSSRLPPGCYAELDGASLRLQRYWQMNYERERSRIDYPSEAREFRRLLEQAVASELGGRESIGCFLSGGTDSSTVAGLITQLSGGGAHTYSIGFDEPGFDEMGYARIAARRFGTRHREYYVTPRDIADMIERIPAHCAAPFGNSSAVPAYYCASMARADGITKLLGGDGGDELFGGNEYYRTQVMFSKYDGLPIWLRERLLEPLVNVVSAHGRVPVVRKAFRYVQQAKMPMPDRLESYNFMHTIGAERMFDPYFLAQVDITHPLAMMREEYDGAVATTMLNRIMSMNVKLTLADNDLRKVGEMTRMAGVKVGYPFLHEDLAAFAARLPVDQKVLGLKLRYFFKKALEDFLPREIIHKKKHGFGLPFGQWLRRDAQLQRRVQDSLHDFKNRGVIRPEFIDELAGRRFLENSGHYGKLIWPFVMLEQWLKQSAGTAAVRR